VEDRQFYDEREETKQIPLKCPFCRQDNSYPVRWKVRSRKTDLPKGASDEDRKRFAKARSYMVRVDDLVACRNLRCRKRFDISGQSVVLI
jgi:hypothetical protein